VTILVLSNSDKPGNENISWELAKIILWPNYEPQVQGLVQNCLDSLPDNRIGRIAGDFLNLIDGDKPVEDPQDLDGIFGNYLKNKHKPENLLKFVNDLKRRHQQIKIKSIVVTNYTVMDLYLSYLEDQDKKNLYMRLAFDEEDDFLIRWVSYDTRPR